MGGAGRHVWWREGRARWLAGGGWTRREQLGGRGLRGRGEVRACPDACARAACGRGRRSHSGRYSAGYASARGTVCRCDRASPARSGPTAASPSTSPGRVAEGPRPGSTACGSHPLQCCASCGAETREAGGVGGWESERGSGHGEERAATFRLRTFPPPGRVAGPSQGLTVAGPSPPRGPAAAFEIGKTANQPRQRNEILISLPLNSSHRGCVIYPMGIPRGQHERVRYASAPFEIKNPSALRPTLSGWAVAGREYGYPLKKNCGRR
jgi:hypothetical protein